MNDLENIVFAMENCLLSDADICEECYQDGPGFYGITCKKNVVSDAVNKLKEQEAKIRSLEQTIEEICCGGSR